MFEIIAYTALAIAGVCSALLIVEAVLERTALGHAIERFIATITGTELGR